MPGLAEMLLRLGNAATGWEGLHNLIGAGQLAMDAGGIPENMSIRDGRIIAQDPDIPQNQAYGNAFIGIPSGVSGSELEDTLRHEGRHSRQADVLGPAMVLAKPLEAFHEYGRGPLERDAFRAEQPSTEFLRKEPGAYSGVVEMLLGSILGDEHNVEAVPQQEQLKSPSLDSMSKLSPDQLDAMVRIMLANQGR